MSEAKYHRVMIKLSGEALAGEQRFAIDPQVLDRVAREIITIHALGVQVSIVVGGGNFWRGRLGEGMDRTTADYMGMLATSINALALQDSLERLGVETRVQTAIEMREIAEPYIRRRAIHHLELNRILIFGCGTGNPFFTTDMAAALRAVEVEAEIILMARNIDGLYDDDPKKNPQAKKITKIGFMDVLDRGLTLVDSTALTLCRDNHLPILVFDLATPGNIRKAACGQDIGTLIGG